MSKRIPEDLISFLYWLKERTEAYWKQGSILNDNSQDNESWIYGARWLGLEEALIDEIEHKFQITFAAEHREFLKILHTIDKKEPTKFYDENDEIYVKEVPFFYNWLEDEEDIIRRMKWPYETILQDVKAHFWIKAWGNRPEKPEEIEQIFRHEFQKAPPLIPIHSHRFVLGTDCMESPVLSVWGSDTIVYGWNMRYYLLNEFANHLSLSDAKWSSIQNEQWEKAWEIPFWKDFF